MVEKVLFNTIAFSLFIVMFLHLVRKNNSNYIYILLIQAIGIFIGFLEVIFGVEINIVIKIISYLTAIVLPILILILENFKKISLTEVIGLIQANFAIMVGNTALAEKYLTNALKKCPDSKNILKKLGEVYEKENKIEDAIKQYELYVNLEYDENTYLKIAVLYEKNGHKENAKTILNDIIKENPKNYDASMALGNLLYEQNEFKNAIQLYSNLLKIYPDKFDIYYALGMTYTMLNDFKNAKENYKMAAEINSMSYHSKYALGQLHLISEELNEAIACFEECTESKELDSKAYYYLARIFIIQGNEEKAINYANLAIDIEPEIYNKIQQDNIFITIIAKLNKPTNISEGKKEKQNKNSNEYLVTEHLERITKLVGKLKNDDIQMIENNIKTKTNEEKEKVEKE